MRLRHLSVGDWFLFAALTLLCIAMVWGGIARL